FFAQLTLLMLFPYLERAGLPAVLFRLCGAVAFCTAVYAVSERRAQWITALALAIPTGVMNVIFTLRPHSHVEVPTLAITILFLGFTLVSLLRAVLRAPKVTSDTIYGAISVYMLMAIVWGVAYFLLETLQPGSLAIDRTRHPDQKLDWFDCVFYSFVTLTSTGYGDMVPVTAPIRSLSILEAVSGVMYMAVLVARLVGLYARENLS
ncbi:MAG TPA: ion channel, partial [Terriglobales bacterium]|nr:ion channel [Terriglobales bacterium]